jgi:hypothetical protein
VPASPSPDTQPRIRGSAAAGTTVTIHTDAACASAPVAQGTAAQFADPGLQVTVAKGSTTTFFAAAANSGGKGACSSGVSYQQLDAVTTPPVPEGSLAPLKPTTSGGPKITINLGGPASCPANATAACNLLVTATASVPLTAFASAKKKTRRTTLARLRAAVKPGGSKRLVLRLSKQRSALWRRAKTLRIRFATRLTVPGGTAIKRTRTVRMKAPQRK